MIDPNNITNFNRTEYELEEFLLFCIIVAGKNSEIQAKKLSQFLRNGAPSQCPYPFEFIKQLTGLVQLEEKVKFWGLGQYSRIIPAFREVVSRFDGKLKTITFEELMSIKGVGPKTANLFLLHTRPDWTGCVLDTHVLRWMRNRGISTPKQSPNGSRYQELQKIFLDLCAELWPNMSVADVDLMIWKEMRGNQ